jgi:hypothetical protein
MRLSRRRIWVPAAAVVALPVIVFAFAFGATAPTRTGLIVASSMLATASVLPYIRETVRRRVQPRLVTWGTWCLLTAMAGIASASVGDYPSAVFSLIGTLATGTVVIVGWRVGDRAFGRIDTVSLLLVLSGTGLWVSLDAPAVAVLTACLIDFVGLVPTAVHAWQHPEEEITSTFVLIAAGGACAGLAAWGDWSVTALAYPVYVAVSMTAVALLTLRPDPNAPAASGLNGRQG